MSNDEEPMMNQAHGLTPDDGHDEDLIAEGPEEMRREMYNFLGEISEQIQAFNAPCRGMQTLVNHQWSLMINCGTRGWLGREFNLYPNASRDVVISRLYNQVWDLLQKMKERVIQRTWKTEDQEIVEGLINIMILSVRNNISTDHILKDQVENHVVKRS